MGPAVENVFESTGQRLVTSLSSPHDPFSVEILVIEAGRVADRLEKLDRLLSGDEDVWLRLESGRDSVLEVRINGAMQEARQQATVLRQLLAEIRRMRGGTGESDEDDPLDDL